MRSVAGCLLFSTPSARKKSRMIHKTNVVPFSTSKEYRVSTGRSSCNLSTSSVSKVLPDLAPVMCSVITNIISWIFILVRELKSLKSKLVGYFRLRNKKLSATVLLYLYFDYLCSTLIPVEHVCKCATLTASIAVNTCATFTRSAVCDTYPIWCAKTRAKRVQFLHLLEFTRVRGVCGVCGVLRGGGNCSRMQQNCN